jgi:hypothetical protein
MFGEYRDHISDYQILCHRITWQRIINPLNIKSNITYLLTYLLTHSTEQSPSWEGNRSQLVKALFGTRRFITAFTSARHLFYPEPAQFSPYPTSHFLKTHLIIILSMPGSPKWSHSFRFPHQNPVYASSLPHTRYMPRPSPPSRCDHPHNCGWVVQIMEFLIMNLSYKIRVHKSEIS